MLASQEHERTELKKNFWTPEEDQKLSDYMQTHDERRRWREVPELAGLKRDGKSCRLRWSKYLRPGIKRGNFSQDEKDTIIRLQSIHGNKWAFIATQLPGRTDNEIKNFWNTRIRTKLGKKYILTATQTPLQPVPVFADWLASNEDYPRGYALGLHSDAQLPNLHLRHNPEVGQGSSYITPDPAAQLHGVISMSTDPFGALPGILNPDFAPVPQANNNYTAGPSSLFGALPGILNPDFAPVPQANNNYTAGPGSLFGAVPNADSTPAFMISKSSDRAMTSQVENETNTLEAWLEIFISADTGEPSDTFCGDLALE